MSLLAKTKRVIPEKLKRRVKLWFASSNDSRWKDLGNSDRRVIYVFLAGFYQNLGDMAITYAQRRFLQELYPEADVVAVPSTSTYNAVKTIKRVIHHDDIVTLIGGGNMDDIYTSLEEARLHVVKSFPNNKVISFPQTFAFSETIFGKRRQEISHRVYSKHKHFTLFVREPYSLARIKAAFPDVQYGYCPDIVLSLNKFVPQCERHGVLCCLRSDKEHDIHSIHRDSLIKAIKEEFYDVLMRDTVDVCLEDCQENRYEKTLEEFWDMLRHKEVVITDRLHCMIFCAITGTPCVVMDNSNHKISGVYRAWLTDADFIRFLESSEVETIVSVAKELSKVIIKKPIDLTMRFEPLRKALQV